MSDVLEELYDHQKVIDANGRHSDYIDIAIEEIQQLRIKNRELVEALEHIYEYWNGACTEMAMSDALEHIEDFVLEQLRKYNL